MMMADSATNTRRVPDFLLSWDRLGFRLVVFGSLALAWILQGLLAGLPWQKLVLTEVGGLMPWAFLTPMVLALDRRIQSKRLGAGGFLGAHMLGMVLVFVPYWLILRTISLIWKCSESGWNVSQLTALIPTTMNLVGGFLNVPFVYFVILLGSAAMKHAQARQQEEIEAGRLARQLSEARLALLQRQLHPHFLFNALQAISTLLHRDPGTADKLLVRLSSLLRAMLDDASSQTLSLRTELDLTRKYVEIEQVRFGERLHVEWNVDDSLFDVQVPSLIVLPLVDNAIRHGFSAKVGPGRLKIGAGSDGSSLLLTVEDDGLGAAVPLRHGLGISNTRERLAAIYGERATLSIDTSPHGGFCATIQIPLREQRT
ncbi:MAG: histidine kinase [Acidobacteria bacterium]|nr:histidine kinase [Acidobacteriota bacterium]